MINQNTLNILLFSPINDLI